jgi:hypothetical protein
VSAAGTGALAATGLFAVGWTVGAALLLLLGFAFLLAGRVRRPD